MKGSLHFKRAEREAGSERATARAALAKTAGQNKQLPSEHVGRDFFPHRLAFGPAEAAGTEGLL